MASQPVRHHGYFRPTHGASGPAFGMIGHGCLDVCLCCLHTRACFFSMPCPLGGSGPFPEPSGHAPHGAAGWGPCSAAGPGHKVEFPWRKLPKRKAAALERDFISIRGALLAGKWDTVAEPSGKICCNHYLCSLFIMHLNETQMHPTHCVNTDLLKLKCYWRCFQFSNTLALC